ncbi:GNAT family N-acetyltransferase [Sulfitobacter sp. HNIBRBA3233]|uniref:GNAT family N-acetyltransferase n=1 Tax=Sulfitobacter marinivivus TaxID=3158558 RepID=UPI0032DF6546
MYHAPIHPDRPRDPHALMQDPAFAAALRLYGEDPLELPGGQILLRRRLMGMTVAMLPRCAPPPDLDAALRAHGLHRQPLILSPQAPAPVPGALRLCAPRERLVLPIAPGADQRRALLHQKWRNQLRRAEDAGLQVTYAPLRPDDDLLCAAEQQSHFRGYRDWPTALTRAFAQVAPDQTRLFTAHHCGAPVAWMLFLVHGSAATYHIGLTTDHGRAVHAHNLVLWRALGWLAARGIASLDMGLSVPEAAGLDRFKQRAGAVRQQTGGTWLRWRPLARGRKP